jgi:hypothetical protein
MLKRKRVRGRVGKEEERSSTIISKQCNQWNSSMVKVLKNKNN